MYNEAESDYLIMAANCYTWFYRSPLVSDLITVNPSNTDTRALRTVATYSVSVQQLHLLVQIENTQLAGDNKYSFGFILRVLQFRIMPPVMLQGEPINATCFYVGPLSLMASGCNYRLPSHSGGGGSSGERFIQNILPCVEMLISEMAYLAWEMFSSTSACAIPFDIRLLARVQRCYTMFQRTFGDTMCHVSR